jgi:hypothetical protein
MFGSAHRTLRSLKEWMVFVHFHSLLVVGSVTAEGATEGTTAVTTKPSPRFSTMDDDELQAVNYNTLTGSDLRAYTDELDRRTPKRPASANGADPDDLDLDDDDSIQPGFEPLPWEDHHPDNNGGQ